MLSFWIERPMTAFVGGLLLIYSPPLLDILPLYILFMLASPILLLHGLRHGWLGIMAVSVALWLAAQFELGAFVHAKLTGLIGLAVPFRENGSFEIFGWQFLWVLGLWMGSQAALGTSVAPRFPPWLVRSALMIALVCLVWRHAVGQAPFGGDTALNAMFDKWHLGPLRLIDFFALLVLVMHFGPAWRDRLPRIRALETLGAASLPVFCAHLILALLALALLGEANPERAAWIDAALLGSSFAILYAVALASRELERQAGRLAQRRASASGSRSPTSTVHSPHR